MVGGDSTLALNGLQAYEAPIYNSMTEDLVADKLSQHLRRDEGKSALQLGVD
jgi:hypothetical protein